MEALFLRILNMSITALAFATNRRFPTASPLAFGEAGILERVKNILRFNEPKKWVIILIAILCIAAKVACSANPVKKATTKENDVPYGNYVFEKQVAYFDPTAKKLLFLITPI